MQSVVRADLTKLKLTGVISCMCIPLAWYEVTLHTLECPHWSGPNWVVIKLTFIQKKKSGSRFFGFILGSSCHWPILP